MARRPGCAWAASRSAAMASGDPGLPGATIPARRTSTRSSSPVNCPVRARTIRPSSTVSTWPRASRASSSRSASPSRAWSLTTATSAACVRRHVSSRWSNAENEVGSGSGWSRGPSTMAAGYGRRKAPQACSAQSGRASEPIRELDVDLGLEVALAQALRDDDLEFDVLRATRRRTWRARCRSPRWRHPRSVARASHPEIDRRSPGSGDARTDDPVGRRTRRGCRGACSRAAAPGVCPSVIQGTGAHGRRVSRGIPMSGAPS